MQVVGEFHLYWVLVLEYTLEWWDWIWDVHNLLDLVTYFNAIYKAVDSCVPETFTWDLLDSIVYLLDHSATMAGKNKDYNIMLLITPSNFFSNQKSIAKVQLLFVSLRWSLKYIKIHIGCVLLITFFCFSHNWITFYF